MFWKVRATRAWAAISMAGHALEQEDLMRAVADVATVRSREAIEGIGRKCIRWEVGPVVSAMRPSVGCRSR